MSNGFVDLQNRIAAIGLNVGTLGRFTFVPNAATTACYNLSFRACARRLSLSTTDLTSYRSLWVIDDMFNITSRH